MNARASVVRMLPNLDHSTALSKAAEAARLFPDGTREIGPAGGHWLALTLTNAGCNETARLLCYFAMRRVLFPGAHGRGDLTKWLSAATVAEVIDVLTKASCEVI